MYGDITRSTGLTKRHSARLAKEMQAEKELDGKHKSVDMSRLSSNTSGSKGSAKVKTDCRIVIRGAQ